MDPPSNRAAEVIGRYSDAPASMPDPVRKLVQSKFQGGEIIYYALSDLDENLGFQRCWIALGKHNLAIVSERSQEKQPPELTLIIPRSQIGEIKRSDGLSCCTMILTDASDGSALAHLNYTRRQHPGFEGLRAAIELGMDASAEAGVESPDSAYLESIGAPVISAQADVAASGTRVTLRLLKYLSPYRAQVAVGMCAAALVALIGLAPPYLGGKLLDTILAPENVSSAWLIVAAITAAVVFRVLFLWLRLHLMSLLGEKVARDLRNDVFGHVHKLSVPYLSKAQTGTLVSRVGSDTDRVWEFITFGIAEAILSALTILSIGTVLIILDWRLGLIMLAPLPVLFLAIIRNWGGIQRGFTKAWRKWASLHALIADSIPGVRVVKAFGREGRERERFSEINEEVYRSFNEVHSSWTRFWPVILLVLQSIGLAVYWAALPRLEGGGIPLSPGTFVSFLLFSWAMIQPVESFAQMGRMANRALSSARRVFELLDTEPEPHPEVLKELESPVRGKLEFRDIWFGYERFKPVLRGISFSVNPGEIVAIAGRSGAGKSTLLQLIPRLYEPEKGTILLDGVDISHCDPAQVRTQIGYVDQEPFLFHVSVLENIRYGRPEATVQDVIEAARIADAHSFVCSLPFGYDTIVGERGHNLSGGERQRIALARAILTKPRILILDEATSSVDGESENRIHEQLANATSGCTTFVIGHRPNSLRRATRVLVLDNGVIAAEGSMSQLLKSNEVLINLYGAQETLTESKNENELD